MANATRTALPGLISPERFKRYKPEERMSRQERFGLTEEEQMLQDMVRRLAKEKVAAGAEERDKIGEYPQDMRALIAGKSTPMSPFSVMRARMSCGYSPILSRSSAPAATFSFARRRTMS